MDFRKLAFLLLVFCSMAVHADDIIYNDYNDYDDGKSDDKTRIVHLYNDVNLMSTKVIEYEKPRIVVIAVYPVLQSEYDNDGVYEFNQLANNFVLQQIEEFKTRVRDNQATQKTIAKSDIKNDLRIDFASSLIRSGKNHIISIRFNVQGTVAGSQPYHFHSAINFNLDTAQEINLSDLFATEANYLGVIARYSSNVLFRRLSERQMILSGTLPVAENFQIWNIKSNGLLITFDEAKVAPASYGTQTILIPFSVLDAVLTSDSPIARCLRYKKTCRSSNVLTGGFIDEAINSRHRSLYPILGKL